MSHRCPTQRGQSAISGPQAATVKWTFGTHEGCVVSNLLSFLSSPAIAADGTIYIGSDDHNLYAFTPDGQVQWTFLSNYTVRSSPAIGADGTVYFCGIDTLYAVWPDGTERWTVGIEGLHWVSSVHRDCAPSIAADGTIYVTSADDATYEGWLHAINPDGTRKWDFETDAFHLPPPAMAPDGTLYLVSRLLVTAIDPDGTERQVLEDCGEGMITFSPVLAADGTLVVARSSVGNGTLCAYRPDGSVKWVFPFSGEAPAHVPAMAEDGTIYVGTIIPDVFYAGRLYAINPDGSQRWEFQTEGWLRDSPVIGGDGTIYFGAGQEFKVYALNPDGTQKWAFETEMWTTTSPALGADGTLVIACYCFLYVFGP